MPLGKGVKGKEVCWWAGSGRGGGYLLRVAPAARP